MTDDTRILSTERHGEYLTALWSDDRAARQWARDRLRDHDAALRAALAAAEETVDDQAQAITLLHAQAADYARQMHAAEKRAEQAERLEADAHADRDAWQARAEQAELTVERQMTVVYTAEAERDQAISTLREALTKYGVHLWPCRMAPHPDHPMHHWEVKEDCPNPWHRPASLVEGEQA